MTITVAALFVDPTGVYSSIDGVDCWGEDRDARKYTGPHPVIAHPPCQLWGKFAKINFTRWGGEHNRPGNDGGCFLFALASVDTYGGVLEHPADSYAWAAHSLPKPLGIGWQTTKTGAHVCEVWQSAYGHKARKRTWLYYRGEVAPFELRWERPVGTHQCGFPDQRGPSHAKPTLRGKEASATPIEFARALISLSRNSV